MQKRTVTTTLSPSAITNTLVYATHPDAAYAEITGIQIANTAGTDYEVDIRWLKDSVKAVSSTHYQGDGVTPAWYHYDYYTGSSGPAVTDIINDGYVPAGAVLSIVDSPLLFQKRDAVLAQPVQAGAINKLSVTVISCEYFDETVDMSTISDVHFAQKHSEFILYKY